MQASSAGLNGLIANIYEAALAPALWTNFLQTFAAHFNSPSSMLWAIDFGTQSVEIDPGSNDLAAFHGLDPAAMASFASYYAQRNVWIENPALHQEGRVVVSSALFPDSRLKQTEYYNDWLRQQDVFYSSAAVVEKRNDRSFNVTLARSERAGAYTPEELQGIAVLMPHLQTGIALHRRLHRLDALAQASVGVLETIPFGIVLLDERGQVLHANSSAVALVRTSRLLHLVEGSAVRARQPADDALLQRHLHSAMQTGKRRPGGAGGTVRLRGIDGAQLQVLVAPLPAWSSPFGQRSTAAIFLSDPRTLIGSLAGMLQALYGMTPAEARLTEAMVNGLTPQEFADRQQISLHTVRTQFKAAAARVGTNRQAELVRIVLTGPAVLRWGEQHGNA